PITRAEIEQVRGVAVDGVVSTLLERGLIENAGRAEVVGRPMTYATTGLFLEYFGLRSLDELPAADELRRIPVQKPEALLTTEAAVEGTTEGQQSAEGAPVVTADTDTASSAASTQPNGTETAASANPESELPR
ncbi:MAG: SMC-Scp complex subunit ScpB, partial [Limisphaerales bacterium]